MIVTVTLNPAVDYLLELDDFCEGQLNRARYQEFSAGGKGINVSLILNTLGVDSVATGFLGGFTGAYIQEQLSSKGLKTHFIEIKDTTRINVKLEIMAQTEINAKAPKVNDTEFKALLDFIYSLKHDDFLVLAGSSIEDRNAYLKLVKIAIEKEIPFVCDVEKQTLRQLLPFQPFLVKPNKYELETFIGHSLNDKASLISAGQKIQAMGAQNVLVSLGKEGSLLVTQDGVYRAHPISGDAKNAVGAGDSMIGGFLADFTRTHDVLSAYKKAVACGTATAFSYTLATTEEITKVESQVKIEKVTS